MTASEDWNIAMDVLLREAWPHGCTRCQSRHLQWAGIRPVGALSIAVTLYERCYQGDPALTSVEALLRRRYGVAQMLSADSR